jgi:hypothetical protein
MYYKTLEKRITLSPEEFKRLESKFPCQKIVYSGPYDKKEWGSLVMYSHTGIPDADSEFVLVSITEKSREILFSLGIFGPVPLEKIIGRKIGAALSAA